MDGSGGGSKNTMRGREWEAGSERRKAAAATTGRDRSLDWRRQRKFSKSAAAHSSSPPPTGLPSLERSMPYDSARGADQRQRDGEESVPFRM